MPTNASAARIVRAASHAGSWYADDDAALSALLDGFLARPGVAPQPDPLARVLICPHAGYAYSGATAAHAYAQLDPRAITRVYVLGPSHHVHLDGCALTRCTAIATPLGDLPVDLAAAQRLADTGHFTFMTKSVDEAEHSLEMQFPYIANIYRNAGCDFPGIVPIMVGDLTPDLDRLYGDLLARELADPHAALIVSTDFCHWGTRFRYTRYDPHPAPQCTCPGPRAHHHHHDSAAHPSSPATLLAPWFPKPEPTSAVARAEANEERGWSDRPDAMLPPPGSGAGAHLAKSPTAHKVDGAAPIWKSIEEMDRAGMHIIERMDVPGWMAYLRDTKNTVCGRNPLRIALVALNDLYEAALEVVAIDTAAAAALSAGDMALPPKPAPEAQGALADDGKLPVLTWLTYAQSSRCASVNDSSVSYAAGVVRVPEGVDRVLGVDALVGSALGDDEHELLRGDDMVTEEGVLDEEEDGEEDADEE